MRKSRSLESYPRPGVSVDLAVLTVRAAVDRPELCVVVQDRDSPAGRALPGAFVRERRTVAETTADVLDRKLNIATSSDVRPRLLRLFDDPDRDDRTWAISAAHSVSMPTSSLVGVVGDLVPVTADGRLGDEDPLLFDHDAIVLAAVQSLRSRYEIRHLPHETSPDPDGFLPEPFTLHQLRKVHEAVLAETLHKDNFNRRMRPLLQPVLEHDGELARARDLRGRPAALFTHTPRFSAD